MRIVIALLLLSLVSCEKVAPVPQERMYQGRPKAYWLQAVQSGDEAARLQGINALGTFVGDSEATAALEKLMGSNRVGERYYAAEAYWRLTKNGDKVIPVLNSVIVSDLGWAYRDPLLKLIKEMGPPSTQLEPAVRQAIDTSPNSRQRKWQEVLAAIEKSGGK